MYWQRTFEIRQKLAPGSLDVAKSLNNLGLLAWHRGKFGSGRPSTMRGLWRFNKKLAPGSFRRGSEPERPRDLGYCS